MNKIDYELMIRELEKNINLWEYHYRVLDVPIVSDEVFDFTKKKLQKLSEEYPEFVSDDSPLKKIGSVLTDGFTKVKHKHIMGSIDNVYSYEELKEWAEKISERLGIAINRLWLAAEDKYDGISGSLHYEDGKLILAATRGNGHIGDDITNNARMVCNILSDLYSAHELDREHIKDFTGEIRGEFVIMKDDLQRINELEDAEFKNVRNLVSGTMKSLDSTVVRNRFVYFIPYYLYDENNKEIDKCSNLGIHLHSALYSDRFDTIIIDGGNIFELERKLENLEDKEHYRYYKNRPYLVDGAVIKVAQIELREKLGYSGSCPNWCVALKFKQEKAITTVKSISWQVGREKITPVAELEPVELEGTTVSRATIHNITQLKKLRITPTCKVEIEKAGFIIPYINKVVEDEGILSVYIPKTCPICNSPTQIVKNESEFLTCTNDFCKAKLKALCNYCVKALKIDSIGKSLINELIEKELIKTPLDILKLSYDTIITLDRMGKTKANKIYKNIQKALVQPLNKVIEFLGIKDVGESNSEKLALQFGSLDKFVNATSSDLSNTENIGEITAQNIMEYFQKNGEYLHQIANIFVIRKDEGFSNKLEGKRFVITGAAVRSREELEALVKKNGGQVSSSVSKKTDYVIIGSKEDESFNSGKKKKAIELGIEIHDEFWLFKEIGYVEFEIETQTVSPNQRVLKSAYTIEHHEAEVVVDINDLF